MQHGQMGQDARMVTESGSEMEDKWLTFWIDRQLFGVTISNVEQIVSMQSITEVPEYPEYAKGIINLRGNIIPLVDLRLRLGKKETEYNDHTCIIIINLEDSQLGFIVDEVDEVLNIPQTSISPPPQIGEELGNGYLTGVARIPNDSGAVERIILCMDATMILRPEEYNSLR